MFEVGRDIFYHGFRMGGAEKRTRLRLVIIFGFFVFAFTIFAARTISLGIQGSQISRRGVGAGEWMADRADIVDRNGDILAKNVMSGHIMLIPSKVVNVDAAANIIHAALPNEYSLNDALKLVSSSQKFVYVKKYASDAARDKVIKAKVPGVEVEPMQTRRYPKRRLFSHAIGLVGNNGVGLEGAELTYNKYLNENKDPLQLSLDARIQSIFYEQLSIAMQKYQTLSAMGMLMNARTGEMIAMVALPDFDPENLSADSVGNHLFKPMRSLYEMGSIFKIFNTAMAFENNITKEYKVSEAFKIYDKNGRLAKAIDDVRSFRPSHPYFSVEEIMVHSSNRGSAQIALDFPDGTQKEFFERVHFNRALDLEFGRTERGLMTKRWGPVERATMSFGHGISVTPMHLLLAVNAMTNGGIYIKPTLHKRGVGAVTGTRVLDEKISERLRGLMLRVAEETSGKQARVAGIKIGGKTGTAEKRDELGRPDKNRNVTAFVGIFPADAPQYVIMVVLDEPHATKESWGWKTAAWNAVPTTGKILESILPLLFE